MAETGEMEKSRAEEVGRAARTDRRAMREKTMAEEFEGGWRGG